MARDTSAIRQRPAGRLASAHASPWSYTRDVGMAQQDPIVCPPWDSQKKRFRGGGRYGATPLTCSRCAVRVAVPLDIWRVWRFDRDCVRFICEQCSLFLEFNRETPETRI